jgi:hypothetical protein
MFYYVVKIAVSAALITAISEIAKRNSGFAALIAALPLTSILAFVWMQWDGAAPEKIAELSVQIFWLVIPSLALFLILPLLLKQGLAFWPSLALAAAATAACYFLLLPALRKFGVHL